MYIEEFLGYLKAIKKHSEYTLYNYKLVLEELNGFLKEKNMSLVDVNRELVKEYLNYLSNKNLSRSSIARNLSAIRSYYNFLLRREIIDINYFSEIAIPKKEKHLPIFLTNEEMNEIFSVTENETNLGVRNDLIIEMLYATGVRVGELVNIRIADIDFSNRMIKILGKGSKERIVIYGHHCEEVLNKYLKISRKELNKKNNDYLFLNKNGEKISERMIRNILNSLLKRTNIDTHVSPHNIRHTFATEMLNGGADLVSVKELLGHESLNTTSIYTHVTDEQIRKVYDNTHPRAKEK
jgi:integrase/recombinase XerC